MHLLCAPCVSKGIVNKAHGQSFVEGLPSLLEEAANRAGLTAIDGRKQLVIVCLVLSCVFSFLCLKLFCC